MKAERYDFGKPGRLAGDPGDRVTRWLRGATALAPKGWAKALPFALDLAVGGVETARGAEALAALPDPAVAYQVVVETGGLATLLAFPRPLVLAVVAGLLGDPGERLPEDRELTSVEESLCQYFFQELLLPPLQEAWPGPTPVRLELLRKEPHPRWSRLFGAADVLVVCAFTLTGPFGEHAWHWLLPLTGLVALLGCPADPAPTPAQVEAAAPRLEALVRELPLEITVVLGTAQVPLAQLAGMRAGDVVLLDQRVAEPLTAAVANGKQLWGWAGRAGTWQAFLVESLTGSS